MTTDRPLLIQEPFRAVFYAPVYAALARSGSTTRLVEGTGADAALRAVRSGEVDVAWGGPMRLILEHEADRGSPLRGFAPFVGRDPFLLVGRGANPGFQLSDLSHLRLGTVSEVPTPWWCLQDDLRRAQVDPAAMHREDGRSMAENLAGVLAGTLDVAQVYEPYAAEAEQAGATVWHAAAAREPTAYTAFYGTKPRIEARRPAIAAFVDSLRDTLSWIQACPIPAFAETVAPMFPRLATPVLHMALDRYRMLGIWPATPMFEDGALARLERVMQSAGVARGLVPDSSYMLHLREDAAEPC